MFCFYIIYKVHVSFLGKTALIERTTAFQFGRDDPYEYGLEKCVAYGFTNRGAYQLERFAVLVRFADRTVALKRFPSVYVYVYISLVLIAVPMVNSQWV